MRSEGVTRRYSSEGTESSEEWASSRCFQKFGNITEYRFNGKCIECGKQGHMSRDCFKKGYCRSCQKYGHRGGQCQKGRDASLCDKTVFFKIPGAPSPGMDLGAPSWGGWSPSKKKCALGAHNFSTTPKKTHATRAQFFHYSKKSVL